MNKEYWDKVKPGTMFEAWNEDFRGYSRLVYYKNFKGEKPCFSNILSSDFRGCRDTYDYVREIK